MGRHTLECTARHEARPRCTQAYEGRGAARGARFREGNCGNSLAFPQLITPSGGGKLSGLLTEFPRRFRDFPEISAESGAFLPDSGRPALRAKLTHIRQLCQTC